MREKMSAPTLTYDQLKALSPCPKAFRRVTKLMGSARWETTAAYARRAGATFDDVRWAASAIARSNPDVERRVRLWLADCAAHVLKIYERGYPNDDRPRNAIIAARHFARGKIRAAASDAARAAARATQQARFVEMFCTE